VCPDRLYTISKRPWMKEKAWRGRLAAAEVVKSAPKICGHH